MPGELLAMLREARRAVVRLRALQQRKEAAHVVELERRFKVLDGLIQRALLVVSPSGEGSSAGGGGVETEEVVEEMDARRSAVAAAASAVGEIERGNRGVGFGLDTKAVSSLLRNGSTGDFFPLLSCFGFAMVLLGSRLYLLLLDRCCFYGAVDFVPCSY